MMNRRTAMIMLSALTALLMASCTIKENRLDCPTWLTLRSDGTYEQNEVVSDSINVIVRSGKGVNVLSGNIGWDVYAGNGYDFTSPREFISLAGLCGYRNRHLSDSLVFVPVGEQFDRVYGFYDERYIIEEEYIIEEAHNQQYATLNITFVDYDNEFPLRVRVVGNTDGIYRTQQKGHRGEFLYEIVDNGSGLFSCRVPRQVDNSLVVALSDKEDTWRKDISVGEYVERQDYDWNKADLTDIPMVIDYKKGTISILVRDWEVILFDVQI